MAAALTTSVGYKIIFSEKQEMDLEVVQPLRHDEFSKV